MSLGLGPSKALKAVSKGLISPNDPEDMAPRARFKLKAACRSKNVDTILTQSLFKISNCQSSHLDPTRLDMASKLNVWAQAPLAFQIA